MIAGTISDWLKMAKNAKIRVSQNGPKASKWSKLLIGGKIELKLVHSNENLQKFDHINEKMQNRHFFLAPI